ncbi:MAG: uroporphyrinogen decarboxylase family protein [Victivallales bacterium]
MLSSKERIGLALEGKPVDHLPFSPFLAYAWEHLSKEIQDAGQLEFHHLIGADPLWRGAPCPVKAVYSDKIVNRSFSEGGLDKFIIETPVGFLSYASSKSSAGNTNFLVEHPLKKAEDFKVQMWIEGHVRYEPDYDAAKKHFAGNGCEGFSVGMLIPRGKSAFQSLVEHHVGTEELAYAMADYPELVEELWNIMVRRDIECVDIASSFPEYEYYLTWEDSSTQNYSPSQFERYIGSEISQWCALLAKNGKRYVQHACGHVKELLEPMKRAGVYAVESISSPPTGNISLSESRKIAGNSFGIIGGIEPTAFLNLNMDELELYVQQIASEGRGGPFVLANSDSCPPGVTVEKFKLVGEIASRLK